MKEFDKKWSLAKSFFYIDFDLLEIKEIENTHHKELYEDVKL